MPLHLTHPVTLRLTHGPLATIPAHPLEGSLVIAEDTRQIFLGTSLGRREITDITELAFLLATGVQVTI